MNFYMKQSNLLRVLIAVAGAFIFLSPGGAQAQSGTDRVAVDLTDPSRPALVKAHLLNGGITVKGTDGKQVVVEAKVRNRESAKSEGNMKRIPINTTGLSVEEENNQVDIKSDALNRTVDLSITVPRHTSLVLRCINDGDIVVSDVDGELDVNDINGAVTLNNIGGSAIAHALNGRILVTFNRIDQKPMSFSSMNGNIDVTFPAALKANVSFQSDRGEVYSDFDVQLQQSSPQQVTEEGHASKGKYRVKIDKSVRGTVNGGGPEIQFKNFNGNIYVRKAGSPK